MAITGRDRSKLHAACREVGPGALAIPMDVRSLSSIREMAMVIGDEFDALDVLFVNAGVAYATPLTETDEESYDRLMDINVKGVFFTMASMVPLMARGSSVILNGSWLSRVGSPGRSVLSASKAAVRSFARVLAAELAPREIRVNAVSPGPIDTPIHRHDGQSDLDYQRYVERVGAKVPAGRMGRPEDVAAAVAFLACDEARFIIGAELTVAGGLGDL